MLDPQCQALLDLMRQRGVPPTHTLAPTEARRLYLERRGFTQPEPPAIAGVESLAADDIPLRLYRPLRVLSTLSAPSALSARATPLPTLVYFHGGGWTIGDLDTHDVLCRQLCAASGCAVVSVDYRLGPEHPFPAAYDDCLAATRHVQAQAGAWGLDAARIAVGGDSAGGNLAAAVAIALRDAGTPVAFQLLIYPATDMRAVAPSHTTRGQGYMLTADSIAYYRRHYVPDASLWTDPRVSPLLAPDLSGLPPALVITAGYDPLCDEGRQYADALSQAGGRTQYVCFERQLHGFITMGRVLDEARSAVALCAAVLREALA